MFYRVEQHIQQRGSYYPAYRNKEGLGAPYHTTISSRLPGKAKFYLVPSLSTDDDQAAKRKQGAFFTGLSAESRAEFFPRYGNPKTGRIVGIGNHLMGEYQGYLHNHLLAAIRPEREPLLKEQRDRQEFEEQMKAHHANIHEDERERNRIFLGLQNMLGQALGITHQTAGGPEALRRFDAVGDTKAYYTKTHG